MDANFVNHDNHSRPCTPEYAEGWDRIFGKKSEPSDSVDVVTAPEANDGDGGDTDAG